MKDQSKVTRRRVLGSMAAGIGLISMPAVLRAQQMKLIGASAVPQTDFIAQSLDVFAEQVKLKSQPIMQVRSVVSGIMSRGCCKVPSISPHPGPRSLQAGISPPKSGLIPICSKMSHIKIVL